MLRIIFGLFFLTSCSHGIYESGGKDRYVYQPEKEYQLEELKELTPKIIKSIKRDTHEAKVDELFSQDKRDLKRVAIVVFESIIQPTRGGLAGANKIYLSAQGKQLLTEKLLSVWEQSFKVLGEDFDYVSTYVLKNSSVFKDFGLEVDDYVRVKRSALAPDDIFYLEGGKETTLSTLINPRGMRDVSLFLVPASELMGGPKWSEHAKHFVNDLARELNLDAVFVIMSEINWTVAHIDKHSGEAYPEEIKISLDSSILIPLTQYHERLKAIGKKEKPNITVCFGTYEAELKVPVRISVPAEEQNFTTVEKELLDPLFKTYTDATQMMIMQMTQDMRTTH